MQEKSNKAVVWSQTPCAWCDAAINFLTAKGYDVEVKKLGNGYTKKDLIDAVPNARSVPQIFINEKYVGGFNELKDLFSDCN